MGELNIPDEAWRGVLDFGIDGVLETVEAATPVIARAAQVAILRKKVAICQEEARIADTRSIRQRWEFMAMWLHNEATELEAGGGQMEEVQGDDD